MRASLDAGTPLRLGQSTTQASRCSSGLRVRREGLYGVGGAAHASLARPSHAGIALAPAWRACGVSNHIKRVYALHGIVDHFGWSEYKKESV